MINDDLAKLIERALDNARKSGELPPETADIVPTLETPRNKAHGDFSSNIALTLKKASGIADSREIANLVIRNLPADNTLIEKVEVAGPGFLNFYLKPTWLHDTLVTIEAQDDRYGTGETRKGEKILIEFVSANPTGPISVVNGRAAALGDVLANLFAAQGAETGREFYINDALNSLQLDKFALSVSIRYQQFLGHPILIPAASSDDTDTTEPGIPQTDPQKELVHFPKDGYRGEYVKDIARTVYEESGAAIAAMSEEDRQILFRKVTLQRMVAAQQEALAAFGLHFDTWFYESSLYETNAVERTISSLRERGYAYEKDGALWLKSSELGDDKDRVLIRSNEKATYIAADAAYHDDKFRRGWTKLINIWGADHHGYVGRLKAGVAALGYDPAQLEIILTQMVSLVRDGEAVIGGKRKGNVIELKEDLIDEIGKDAARFYFLLNSYETPATVDVELAKKQSNENPVYYVQYAHARLCSILKKAQEQGYTVQPASAVNRDPLTHPAELDVLRKLADYPAEVVVAANQYAPHRLTRYAMDMASLLNIFYENCRVLSGEKETVAPEMTAARLTLVNGSRIVLRNLLTLLGVTAPEAM